MTPKLLRALDQLEELKKAIAIAEKEKQENKPMIAIRGLVK